MAFRRPGDLDEHDVARRRPVLLVQPAEVVDVDQQDRGRGVAALGAVQLDLEELDQVAAVVGVGERVDLRLALRLGVRGDGLGVGGVQERQRLAQLDGARATRSSAKASRRELCSAISAIRIAASSPAARRPTAAPARRATWPTRPSRATSGHRRRATA